MRMGWATPSYHAGQHLGADENSYAFDGFLVCELPFDPLFLYPLPPTISSLTFSPNSPSSPLFSPPLTRSLLRRASGTMGQRALVGGGILVISWDAYWILMKRPSVWNACVLPL